MKKQTMAFAGGVLALGLLLGAPAAAMAAGGPYAPIPGGDSQTVSPGTTVTLTTAGWLPSEVITITYPDSFTLAASTNIIANGSGVASISFTGSTTGTFPVVFNGAFSGSITLNVTVTPSIAFTGVADPTPYLWLGGGLALAGIAAVVTAVAVRRQRASISA